MKKNEKFATKDIKGNYITFDNRAETRDAGQFASHKVVKVRVIEASDGCEWKFDNIREDYLSECGHYSYFSICFKAKGYKYCPFCGLPIKESKEKK